MTRVLCVGNMCSFVVSKTKAIILLLASLIALATSEDYFTATPKDKEVFLGESVQFDWDYLDSLDVEEVRFGVYDSKTDREVAIVKKIGETLHFNNQLKAVDWIRDRVEVVGGRRASFKINQVQMNDSRTFLCILMTRDGKSMVKTVKLNVVDLLIDKLQSTQLAESWVGHKLRVLCAVRVPPGGTSAKFSWMHTPSNRTIARQFHDDTRSKSYLTIMTYKDEDFEAPQCRAETKATVKFHIIDVTKLSPPTEPRNLKAERIFNKQNARRYIRLHWDPPRNNGGADIEKYFVYYVPKGLPWKSSTIEETKSTEFSDLKLPSGNIYNARVRANNKAGTGPHSNEVEINLEDSVLDSGPYTGSVQQYHLKACLMLLPVLAWFL